MSSVQLFKFSSSICQWNNCKILSFWRLFMWRRQREYVKRRKWKITSMLTWASFISRTISTDDVKSLWVNQCYRVSSEWHIWFPRLSSISKQEMKKKSSPQLSISLTHPSKSQNHPNLITSNLWMFCEEVHVPRNEFLGIWASCRVQFV